MPSRSAIADLARSPPTAPPRLTHVALPLFGELALGVGVAATGLTIAARLGEAPAAAYLLALHVLSALVLLLRVVGAGVGVVVAQALGKGDRPHADAVARAAIGAATWVGLAAGVIALVGGQALLRAVHAPDAVRPAASALLMAMAPVLLLDAWVASMGQVLRAHLRGRDTLRVVIAMHLLHLPLAWFAMHGFAGWDGFGLVGFGVAGVISRCAALALLWHLWTSRLGLHPTAADTWRWPRRTLDGVVRIGWPSAAEAGLYRLCFMVSVAAAGTLGSAGVAAQGFALQINHLTLLFGLALGLAAEIVVGHRVGAHQLHAADQLVRRALSIGVMASVWIAVVAWLSGPWLLRIFTDDPALIALASPLLLASVALEPGRAFNLVLVNALRATGDTRFPLVAGIVSMTLVLGIGSWLLAVEAGLGLLGVWIAYAADEWVRGLAMWWRWRSRAWVPAARRSRRALSASRPRVPAA